MNKKIVRIMSFVLSVMMLFSCVVVANAAESTEKITVSIRVEGTNKTLKDKDIRVPESSTVKEIIDAANLDVKYAEANPDDITEVMGESEISGSEWQYAVGGTIRKEAVSQYKVEEGTEIVLFNATEDAVMPSWNADEVALSGIITFTGTDKNGAAAPIEGATIIWEGSSENYVTDAKGKIYLPKEALKAGNHTVQIEKKNGKGIPTVVRFETAEQINVSEIVGEDKGELTFFDEVYNFFLDIFEGIVEVWAFFISEILGLFGVELDI